MNILADTHIVLWALTEPAKLSEHAKELLEDRGNVVYYSLAAVWEVAIKHAISEERMPCSEERFVELCSKMGFAELPINARHIYEVKTLHRPDDAPRHNDPFDRLMVAQAKSEGMTFLTHDSLLPYYGETCVKLC